MRLFHMIVTVLFINLSVLAAPRNTFAETEDAREAFETGNHLFETGDFQAAADSFRQAWSLKPNWRLFYNIGQSEAAAKRHGLALEALERYLSEGGDDVPDDRRSAVITDVQRLREMVGLLEVNAPPGYQIRVDNVIRGTTPLVASIPVAAGINHTVEILQEDTLIAEQVTRVLARQTRIVDFSDIQMGSATFESTEPPSIPASPREKAPRSPLLITGWVLTGSGIALGVGATITGAVALKTQNDGNDNWKPLAVTTDVLIGTGAALLSTGVVLLVLSRTKNDRSALTTSRPRILPGIGGAEVRWAF